MTLSFLAKVSKLRDLGLELPDGLLIVGDLEFLVGGLPGQGFVTLPDDVHGYVVGQENDQDQGQEDAGPRQRPSASAVRRTGSSCSFSYGGR